jgi:hypothetical protein
MYTKVFVFTTVSGSDTLWERAAGTNELKKFDDYRREGWRPLHWQDISAAGQTQFRVIMEHDERRTRANGAPASERRRGTRR